ncbi:MAG: hypothetical protein WD824_02590 [Cyclobacteriaceae bacterium]
MKLIKLIGCLLIIAGLAAAQSPLQFFAHADVVKPSMNADYFKFLKNVKETYQRQGVTLNYNVLRQDDNTFYFFSPMQDLNIGAVYKGFGEIENKVGKEAFAKLLAEKERCIESHSEFVTMLLPQYTYLAPGESENFCHIVFWFPMPGKQAEVDQIAKEWIELYKAKNAPRGYQTYRIVFGGEPGYIIVNWAKDELDYATKSKKNNEVMGEEASRLWARTMAITQRLYSKNGWYLRELSYTYQPVAAK